jgi:F-type H+-transporting ATPase subunit delta
VQAEVFSAFELTEAQLADLAQRLEKKTGRKIRTAVHVDKNLIGGIKIAIGDKVIDGSVRGQLGALENALKA